MQVAVWGTYVRRKNGTVMHFDVIVPEHIKSETEVLAFGRQYLETKGEAGQPLTAKECRYCHMEKATPEIESCIKGKGYFILEMENCK